MEVLMKPIELAIDGMHCDGCVRRVSEALKKIPGVTTEKVEVGKASLKIDDGKEPVILAALEDIGFDARVAKSG
jgi:copper chaperone CopZ